MGTHNLGDVNASVQPKLYKNLEDICAHLSPCELYPEQFFVAWHGVITLALRAFPLELIHVKQRLKSIDLNTPDVLLPAESPGSRWPKITLAALRPESALSASDLEQVCALCAAASAHLRRSPPLKVESLTIVHYVQQSLERITERWVLPLGGEVDPRVTLSVPPPLQDEVRRLLKARVFPLSAEERARILAPGRDVSHYRAKQGGVSLVAEVPRAYQAVITLLIEQLERALPGRYVWFEESSRHMTLRAL